MFLDVFGGFWSSKNAFHGRSVTNRSPENAQSFLGIGQSFIEIQFVPTMTFPCIATESFTARASQSINRSTAISLPSGIFEIASKQSYNVKFDRIVERHR
jgi:hypothetical protein